jgi:hypothetical protein
MRNHLSEHSGLRVQALGTGFDSRLPVFTAPTMGGCSISVVFLMNHSSQLGTFPGVAYVPAANGSISLSRDRGQSVEAADLQGHGRLTAGVIETRSLGPLTDR